MIPRFNFDGFEEADGWWYVFCPPRTLTAFATTKIGYWNPESGRVEG